MRSLKHGPGVRFHPTDEELTMYYLQRKVTGTKFYRDGIQDMDVYNLNPWDLKGPDHWTRDLKWYFFCPRERKCSAGKRTNRSTEHGSWKTTGKDRKVFYNGEIVAMIKSLIFYKRDPTERTDWVMHEYKLQDEYLERLGFGENGFVLCVIFEKDGPGPRNGAQYGAPYRDEDWDDVNDGPDNRREDTHGVGALTHVHDSTDKGKSTVPDDLDRADGYYVGSSSRTLPSDIETPVPGTLSASLGHEQTQDIDADQVVNYEPTILANEENIFGGLGELCSLEDFTDPVVGACDNDFLANRMFPLDDFMELADCIDLSGPFEEGSQSLAKRRRR